MDSTKSKETNKINFNLDETKSNKSKLKSEPA